MKNSIYLIFSLFFLYSCTSNDTVDTENDESPEVLLNKIEQIDDSLQTMIDKRLRIDTFKIDKLVYHEAINRNKKFYSKYPKHEKAEESLNKIASLYMQLGIEREATKWRDSIILNYPNTPNKIGLLELQLSYYDYDNYNPEKIEFYINQLMKIEGLPADKKEDYQFRLKHIDKTFEELIELRANELLDSLQSEKSNV